MMPDDVLRELKDGLLSLDMEAALRAANTVIKGDDKAIVKEAVDVVAQGLQIVGISGLMEINHPVRLLKQLHLAPVLTL
jgi:hypothetical protein